MRYTDEQIARVIHAVNGVLQEIHGEAGPQPDWQHTPKPMRARVLALVRLYRSGGTPRAAHEQWVTMMEASGWRHGLEKSSKARTHPNMVSYPELPQCQRIKDSMSHAVTQVMVAGGEGL